MEKSPEQQMDKLKNQDLNGFGLPAMTFVKESSYTTFSAEVGFDRNDIVFHFFLPDELVPHHDNQAVIHYWLESMKKVIGDIVPAHFEAGYPQLIASYTPEMGSWWLRANGFANQPSTEWKVQKLFVKMDQALEPLFPVSVLKQVQGGSSKTSNVR